MCIDVCVDVHTGACVHVHRQVHRHVHLQVYRHVHRHVHRHTDTCVCVAMRIDMYIHMNEETCNTDVYRHTIEASFLATLPVSLINWHRRLMLGNTVKSV